eukprot:CAMPEP_0169244014 /NCGR_PEP_ID=MMETSP1016-20121227/33408_1 /TAXON_ID=342587 /ORGANISM="Karlodinium micrum, Strain CCMP2283" /LENGTH=35 /DNA_ID= /DNA_START= /DNA_END= /DNA_ORIENTATION=
MTELNDTLALREKLTIESEESTETRDRGHVVAMAS